MYYSLMNTVVEQLLILVHLGFFQRLNTSAVDHGSYKWIMRLNIFVQKSKQSKHTKYHHTKSKKAQDSHSIRLVCKI